MHFYITSTNFSKVIGFADFLEVMSGREGNLVVSGGNIQASSEKTCLEPLLEYG